VPLYVYFMYLLCIQLCTFLNPPPPPKNGYNDHLRFNRHLGRKCHYSLLGPRRSHETGMTQIEGSLLHHTCFCLSSFSESENGGDMFLRNDSRESCILFSWWGGISRLLWWRFTFHRPCLGVACMPQLILGCSFFKPFIY
jgi:hypothetical protein